MPQVCGSPLKPRGSRLIHKSNRLVSFLNAVHPSESSVDESRSGLGLVKMSRHKPTPLLTLILMLAPNPSLAHPTSNSQLIPRYVPPSVYIHAGKLSAKLIALIVILVVVTALFSTCLCYICIKRRRSRARRRRLEKERRESKQLKPRINGRNARFFAPGLFKTAKGVRGGDAIRSGGESWRGSVGSERGSLDKKWSWKGNWGEDARIEEIEMRGEGEGRLRGMEGVKGNTDGKKGLRLQMPEKAWLKWGRR